MPNRSQVTDVDVIEEKAGFNLKGFSLKVRKINKFHITRKKHCRYTPKTTHILLHLIPLNFLVKKDELIIYLSLFIVRTGNRAPSCTAITGVEFDSPNLAVHQFKFDSITFQNCPEVVGFVSLHLFKKFFFLFWQCWVSCIMRTSLRNPFSHQGPHCLQFFNLQSLIIQVTPNSKTNHQHQDNNAHTYNHNSKT